MQPEKPTKLIVTMAWDANEDGEMIVAYEQEQMSEDRAIRTARTLAAKHGAVIAWSREANPTIGEYGEPTELFRYGPVPDME